MNFKNLIMWAIIVLLSVGLFNMFQDPNKIKTETNNLPFSNFLNEVENGRVVEVKYRVIIFQVFYLMEKLLILILRITQS